MVNKDVVRVSEILGINIRALYQFSNNQAKHYYAVSIPKKNGGERKLNLPSHYLKHIQRTILDKMLYSLSVSEYAKAYIPSLMLYNIFPKNNSPIFQVLFCSELHRLIPIHRFSFYVYAGAERKMR